MKHHLLLLLIGTVLFLIGTFAFSSTTINGDRVITGASWNASAVTHTLPTLVVANTGALPASGCTAGELAVVTGATLGQQLYENSGSGTCTWTQQLNSGTATGGGITMYSATGLTVTANTYYIPIGGGGSLSTTEANVDIDSPAAATITNMYVQLSVALGGGNSGVFTMRKNAASQSVTCTISGASATNCSDTTHSFAVSQGDLLTIQLVTTGTIVVTPNILIAAQFGNITATGTVNTGTTGQLAYFAANGTAISGLSKAAVNAPVAYASIPSCTTTPFLQPLTDSNYLVYCDGASTLTYYFNGKQITLAGPSSGWTLVTAGSAAKSDAFGGVVLSTTNATVALEGLVRAVPSTPYTKKLVLAAYGGSTTTTISSLLSACGVFWSAGTATSSAIDMLRPESFTTGTAISSNLLVASTFTSFAYAGAANTTVWYGSQYNFSLLYLWLSDDGTNRLMKISPDGVNWVQLRSLGHSTVFTPADYGFGCSSQAGDSWTVALLGEL